jgi:hypothetical protein
MNKFYNRIYICEQTLSGTYTFKSFKSLESIETYQKEQKEKGMYLSLGSIKDSNSNILLPVYGKILTAIPVCKYCPIFLDGLILRYEILKKITFKVII